MKAGISYPGRPVVVDLRGTFGAVLHPLTRIPGHHAWRGQYVPVTLLVRDPDGAIFNHRHHRRSSTESFDPPATVAVMSRAAAAVDLEAQHDLIVASFWETLYMVTGVLIGPKAAGPAWPVYVRNEEAPGTYRAGVQVGSVSTWAELLDLAATRHVSRDDIRGPGWAEMTSQLGPCPAE